MINHDKAALMNTENAVLALDRIEWKFERLRVRLAAVEAERDAARAEAARIETLLQATLMQHRHDIRDLGQLLQDERCKVVAVEAERDAQSALADQAVKALAEMNNANGKLMMDLAAVMNERDAAQAEAARAVEALSLVRKELGTIAQGYEEEVRNDFTSGQSHGWGMAYLHAVQIIGGITDGPALSWLAQQRREAAAEALENVRIGWLSDNDYRPGIPEIWRYIADRAATLRAGAQEGGK